MAALISCPNTVAIVRSARLKSIVVLSRVFTKVEMARNKLTESEILDILYGEPGSEIEDSDREDSYSPDESTSDDTGMCMFQLFVK